MFVIAGPVLGFLLGVIIILFTIEKIHHWQNRRHCPLSGRIFILLDPWDPCPCHGKPTEEIVARWRGKWEVKR